MAETPEHTHHIFGKWTPIGASYNMGSYSILLTRYDEEGESWQFKHRELGMMKIDGAELDPETGEWYDDE